MSTTQHRPLHPYHRPEFSTTQWLGDICQFESLLPMTTTTTDLAPLARTIRIPRNNRTHDVDCTYHAGIAFAFFVPNKTMDLTLGTLRVGVTEHPTGTTTNSTWLGAPDEVTSSDIISYAISVVPHFSVWTEPGERRWAYTFYDAGADSTTATMGLDLFDSTSYLTMTSGQIVAELRALDILYTTYSNQIPISTACHESGAVWQLNKAFTVPAEQLDKDVMSFTEDEDELEIPRIREAMKAYWPRLEECDGYAFGFPMGYFAVNTVIVTETISHLYTVPTTRQTPLPGSTPKSVAPATTLYGAQLQTQGDANAATRTQHIPPSATLSIPLAKTTLPIVQQPDARQATIDGSVINFAGSPLTLNNGEAVVSWGSAGYVIYQASTIPLGQKSDTTPGTYHITLGGKTLTYTIGDSQSTMVIGSATLTAGGAALTVGGSTLTLNPNGLVVGSESTISALPHQTGRSTTSTKASNDSIKSSSSRSNSVSLGRLLSTWAILWALIILQSF